MRVEVVEEFNKQIGPDDSNRRMKGAAKGISKDIHVPGGKVGETYDVDLHSMPGYYIALIESLPQNKKDHYVIQYKKATELKQHKRKKQRNKAKKRNINIRRKSKKKKKKQSWTGRSGGVTGEYGTPFKSRNKNHLLNGKL